MATLSADNTSVSTSLSTNADFDNLAAKFNVVTFVNSPTKANATSAALPASTAFAVSETLPPTPDDAAHGGLAGALGCVFQPPTDYSMVLVGTLIGIACELVGEVGGTCDDISSNGQAGVYGRLAMCDPTIKLSYVMSQYYELNQLNHRAPTACSFSGNATITLNSTVGASSASAAASSAPPVLIPHPRSATPSASSTGGAAGSSNNNNTSGARRDVWVGVGAVAGCVVGGMVWTLALV
ncbi:X8 domain-containing protein [Mycena epipterygia]|nr:X8 domain-containing protein [Mycena epipterygia]